MLLLKEIIPILKTLVAYPSVTPDDAGCQDYLACYLTSLGFQCTRYDSKPVSNLYAQYGTTRPLLVFAGHTDVVTPGDHNAWKTPPFELTEQNGDLVGRGVADMKGALAAMMVMARHIRQLPLKGSLGFLITSGEEGDQFEQGTPVLMQHLAQQGLCPDYCIVGEPTSERRVGDTIKIGRRGSLTAEIIVTGQQGHVAYPHLAVNPIHLASRAIEKLSHLVLDEGTDYFPPSTLQITHVSSGVSANNVIPAQLRLICNVRFNTIHHVEAIKEKIHSCFDAHHPPTIHWRLNGEPFLTKKGRLLEVATSVIQVLTQCEPHLSTSGGTSDGRFIAPYGTEVIELGLCHASIHQVNETIRMDSLTDLATLYIKLAQELI